MRLRLLLAVALVASCSAPAKEPGNDRARRINADLDALVEAVTTIHPEPFARMPEAVWRGEVDAVRREAHWLSDKDFFFGVARLANLGPYNGHGGVFPTDQPSLRMVPVRLHLFPEGWHVVDARDRTLIGTKLPVESTAAVEPLRPIVPGDNDYSRLARMGAYLAAPSLRYSTGISVQDSRHQLREVTETVSAAEWAAFAGVDVPQIPLGLPRPAYAPPDDPWWSVRRGDALLIGYERVVGETDDGRTLRAFADRVRADVARLRPRVVVVDIRRNPGGDMGDALPMTALVRELAVQRRIPVRVLISWATYSAACVAFAELREEVPLRFYGEPTGGGSFTYGNPSAVTLPHSGIVVQIPGAPAGQLGVDALEPDVRVAQTWRDWVAGRDTILERALAG